MIIDVVTKCLNKLTSLKHEKKYKINIMITNGSY